MDGTVLDTMSDLADSLYHVLGELGYPNDYTVEDAGKFFGSGVTVACQRAIAKGFGLTDDELALIGTPEGKLPEEVTPQAVEKLEKGFAAYYPDHSAIRTAPFPGIPELIKRLSDEGCRLAVASNKINSAVQDLTKLYFGELFERAIGVDETIRRKPHPDILFKIMDEFSVKPEETVLVGDTEIDVRTAANAGVDCICVNWGFRSEEFLRGEGVTEFARTADELYRILEER